MPSIECLQMNAFKCLQLNVGWMTIQILASEAFSYLRTVVSNQNADETILPEILRCLKFCLLQLVSYRRILCKFLSLIDCTLTTFIFYSTFKPASSIKTDLLNTTIPIFRNWISKK